MILRQFFRPKWQHPRAGVRERAVQRLEAGDPVLLQLAREDPDTGVRKAALERISDLAILQQVLVWDEEQTLREYACERLCRLLSGSHGEALALTLRISALGQISDSNLLAHLMINGVEADLRKAVAPRIADQELLARVVLEDSDVGVRLKALEGVQDGQILERISKQARKGDKRIGRVARERAAALREGRRCAERLESICEDLEQLLGSDDLARVSTRLQQLTKEWSSIEEHAEQSLHSHFGRLREQLRQRLGAAAATRARKTELLAELEALERRLVHSRELTPELLAEADASLAELRAGWDAAGVLAEAEEAKVEQPFERLFKEIEAKRVHLLQDAERSHRMRDFLNEVEQRATEATVVEAPELEKIQRRWRTFTVPRDDALARELQSAFDAQISRIGARANQARQETEQALTDVGDVLAELDVALDAGQLQRSISLRDRARHRLSRVIGVNDQRVGQNRDRLRASSARIEELRGWRRWGTDHAREDLCEQAEALPGSEHDPVALAGKIRGLRTAWRKLDKAEGASAEALWERFNTACNKAYEPCQVHFEQERQRREQNYAAKIGLCELLARLQRDTDWDAPDWPVVDKEFRNAQESWRRIGPVPRVSRREVEKRFAQALHLLDERLAGKRQEERHRRERLIEQVERMADVEDIREAVNQAKAAQAQWRPAVLGARREEQALWRRFRAACDRVFERRAEQFREVEEQRSANLRRRQGICAELESIVGGDAGEEPGASRVCTLQDEWAGLGPLPRETMSSLEARFRGLLGQFDERRRDAVAVGRLRRFEALRARCAACAQVEALLENCAGGAPAETLSDLRAQWDGLPDVEPNNAPLVQGRFDAAAGAARSGGDPCEELHRQLAANIEAKRDLCLRLEVMSGIESPREYSRERMEFQVSRLSEAFGGDRQGRSPGAEDDPQELESIWLVLGALPAAENAVLEARIERAWEVLLES